MEYLCVETEKGLEATEVRAAGGGSVRGSHRRPGAKKKSKKARCYNCGEFGSHLASSCPQEPMSKRCYNCKSADHLIEECPTLDEQKRAKVKKAAAAAAEQKRRKGEEEEEEDEEEEEEKKEGKK